MNKTLIIAEAGVNHNGDINLAHKLIDEAVKAGADIIKFQIFSPINLTTEYAELAEYQKDKSGRKISQLEMLKNLTLNIDNYFELIKHCNDKNIEFLITAFDFESLNISKKFKLKRNKIPSGEITNLPFLRKVAEIKKPIILSTGMSTLDEVKTALNEINKAGLNNNDITVLHCTSEYPAPISSVNLKAMNTIKQSFGVDVGYSDHTDGIDIAIAAVALGGTIIEKHITLNRNLSGPDHKASIEPYLFSKMVESIRRIEISLGNGNKIPSLQELENRKIVRKSIIAKEEINIGDIFNKHNICIKRPGQGISPIYWDKLIGSKSKYKF